MGRSDHDSLLRSSRMRRAYLEGASSCLLIGAPTTMMGILFLTANDLFFGTAMTSVGLVTAALAALYVVAHQRYRLAALDLENLVIPGGEHVWDVALRKAAPIPISAIVRVTEVKGSDSGAEPIVACISLNDGRSVTIEARKELLGILAGQIPDVPMRGSAP